MRPPPAAFSLHFSEIHLSCAVLSPICGFVAINCSLPGSSAHGIFQARIMEWSDIPKSRGSSTPRDRTHVSCVSCIGWQSLYHQTFSQHIALRCHATRWLPLAWNSLSSFFDGHDFDTSENCRSVFFGREPKDTGDQETAEQTSVDAFSLSLRKTVGSLPYLVKANTGLKTDFYNILCFSFLLSTCLCLALQTDL